MLVLLRDLWDVGTLPFKYRMRVASKRIVLLQALDEFIVS